MINTNPLRTALRSVRLTVVLITGIILITAPDMYSRGDSANAAEGLAKISSTSATGKAGSAYRLFNNKINLPMNSEGVLAAVSIAHPDPDNSGLGGKFANKLFLYAGGFFLSGYADTTLWTSGVAPAAGINDYTRGTAAGGSADQRAQLYVVKASEAAFSQSWLDWKDAVLLGADFYDGDGNGYYTPVDKNKNGIWDPDEDAPDMLGDETVWCAYNDNYQSPRGGRFSEPVGIDVKQTVFSYASEGPLGNMIFVRYRITYTGLDKAEEPDTLKQVYFGVWADPDIGGANDDLAGCDTLRNAGMVYQRANDFVYGSSPPCFIIDFFSGPAERIPGITFTDVNGNGRYDTGIDIALDTAKNFRGQLKGMQRIPGAKNMGVSSFVNFMNNDPDYRDPRNKYDVRNAMLGRNKRGEYPNPCTLSYGSVSGGVSCSLVTKWFWYSGDPTRNRGWLNRTGADQRLMTNTGPFTLAKGEQKEIVVAYVVAQGTSPLNGVTKAREVDDVAQFIFSQNFATPAPPPAPMQANGTLEVSTGEQFIDILINTAPQVGFSNTTVAYNLQFKGYKIYAYKSPTESEYVNGLRNRFEAARYDRRDFIKSIYKKNTKTGGYEVVYPAADEANKLDSAQYANPETGQLRLRLMGDPIIGSDFVKGKEYYFAVVSYAVNYMSLLCKQDSTLPLGTVGDYFITANTIVGTVENPAKIIRVVFGGDRNAILNKVNVYPNPLYGFNPATSYSGGDPDKPFVTFINVPSPVTIKIYTLAGTLIRTLTEADKASPDSPFLKWDLKNEDDLRAASGMYLAVVSSPELGSKVLKFSIILPALQLVR